MSMQLTDSRDYLPNNSDNRSSSVNSTFYHKPRCWFKAFWNNRTHLEKNLLIFASILIFLFLVFMFVFLVVISRKSGDSSVCNTEVCFTYAQQVSSMMDTSLDPCVDFYDFTCGSWRETTELKPGKTSWSYVDGLYRRNLDRLTKILRDQSNQSLAGGLSKSFDSLDKAVNYYKACKNMEARNENGYDKILQLLESIGGWPLINGSWRADNYNWEKAIIRLNQQFPHIPYILNFLVHYNSTDRKKTSIYVSEATILGDVNALNENDPNNERIKAYKQFIKDVAHLIGKENLDQEVVDKDVDDMIKFERALVAKATELHLNPYSRYKEVTFSDLQKHQSTNWLNLINSIFNVSLTESNGLYVKNLKYFHAVGKILAQTSNRILANYIGWRTTHLLAAYSTQHLLDLTAKYNQFDNGGELSSTESICLSSAMDNFQYAIAFKYVEQYFNRHVIKRAREMSIGVKRRIQEWVESITWMDEGTRRKASNKISELTQEFGYPFWLSNETAVDGYYHELGQMTDEDYLGDYLEYQKWSTRRQLTYLTEEPKYVDWPFQIVEINGAYVPTLNKLLYTAAQLDLPFYSTELPAAINYGSLGSVMAHEMTHAVDIKGSLTNEYGTSKNWWSAETMENFANISKCFVNQYNKYFDSDSGLTVNGTVTLNENVADINGLRRAFEAFTDTNPKLRDKTLPYPMDQYTSEQLFYISFASTYCSKARLGFNPQQYSPPHYRVVGAITNSEEFAKAFRCSRDSSMSSQNICSL